MNTAVATRPTNAVAAPVTIDVFAQEALASGVKSGVFLQVNGNDGMFTYGPKDDKKELPHGTCLAARLQDYMRGWFCWKDKEVVDRVMVGILHGQPPTDVSLLPNHEPYAKYKDGTEDGWTKAGEITMVEVNEGLGVFNFSFYAETKVQAFARLCGDYSKVYRLHQGEVPVIQISARGFTPKGVRAGETKYAPVYKIVGWITDADYAALVAQADVAAAPAEDGADDPGAYASEGEPLTTVQTPAPAPAVAAPVEASAPAAAAQVETVPAAAPATDGRRARRFGGAG